MAEMGECISLKEKQMALGQRSGGHVVSVVGTRHNDMASLTADHTACSFTV